MNHHWRQQSPCILPARLHKPLVQGGSCSLLPHVSCASLPLILTLPQHAQTSSLHLECTHDSTPHIITPQPHPTHRTWRHMPLAPLLPHLSPQCPPQTHNFAQQGFGTQRQFKVLSRLNRQVVISKGRLRDLSIS